MAIIHSNNNHYNNSRFSMLDITAWCWSLVICDKHALLCTHIYVYVNSLCVEQITSSMLNVIAYFSASRLHILYSTSQKNVHHHGVVFLGMYRSLLRLHII